MTGGIALGDPVDRRRIELQIRAVLVVYRAQRRLPRARSIASIQQRAREILTDLDAQVGDDAELQQRLADAVAEVDRGEP